MDKKYIYIGLDVSSSVTGISAIDEDEKIVFCEYIDLRKEKNLYKKAKLVLLKLNTIKQNYNILDIGIEDNLLSYQKTSKRTLIILAKMNGIVGFICLGILGRPPEGIHPLTARKKIFGKAFNKNAHLTTKEFILTELINIYNENILASYMETNKKNEIKKETYDAMDALVIALAVKKINAEKNN